MRKTRTAFTILIALCLALMSLLVLSACRAPSLAEPTNLTVTDNRTFSWSAVTHAKGYTVDINGDRIDTRRTSVSIQEYEPGKYTLKVKALGDGEKYSDSAWASLEFEKEYESGMKYSPSSDGNSYEVSKVDSSSEEIVIGDTYQGLPITSIGENAFSNSSRITLDMIVSKLTQRKTDS